ncbi:MAG TPA: MFS transporter [Candidatus Acidoferrales bacterium]|nr:MFS transporter [Candidatus Acidoferrales bacterium]
MLPSAASEEAGIPLHNDPHSEKLSPTLRAVLILLTLSIFINYIDRGNLSVAAPLLKDELRLSPSELGILLSAFFWSYTAFQIPSGWLIDRLDVTKVLAFGFFIWSCATSITGLMHGFAALLVVRLVLGVGEAVAYPSYAKILARDFSVRHRGLGNGAIAAGQFTGPAVATFAGGILMADFGWRPFFIVLGLISLAWVIPWVIYSRPLRTTPISDASTASQSQNDARLETAGAGPTRLEAGSSRIDDREPPPLTTILRDRSFSGACIAHFACNYLTYFLLTWLPYYLVRQRHFSMEGMAKIGGMVFLMSALSSALSGWLSDHWVESGPSGSGVRKLMFIVGLTGSGVSLMAAMIVPSGLSVVLLIAAGALYGIANPLLFAGAQTLAGPSAAGQWMGAQNFAGNLAGIIAPALTGFLVDITGNFIWAVAVLGCLTVVGSLAWLFVVGRIAPVSWPARRTAAAERTLA